MRQRVFFSKEESTESYKDIRVSEDWGITFRPDYIADGEKVISFGKPEKHGKYKCSERVVEQYTERNSKVFAFVEHPCHGIVAVTSEEFSTLGLPEIVMRG